MSYLSTLFGDHVGDTGHRDPCSEQQLGGSVFSKQPQLNFFTFSLCRHNFPPVAESALMLLNTDLILLQREVKIYDAGPKPP